MATVTVEDSDCSLCGNQSGVDTERIDSERLIYSVDCEVCGSYEITEEAQVEIERDYQDVRYLLSGYVSESNLDDIHPRLTSTNLDSIVSNAPEAVTAKADRFLLNLANRSEYYGDELYYDYATQYPLAYARNYEELQELVRALHNRGLVRKPSTGDQIALTLDGWNRVENLETSSFQSDQAFVAMWLGDDFEDQDALWAKGIQPAVKEAGYDPFLVTEEEHVEMIDSLVIKELKRSRFVVADVTGARPSVYFEAGFALGRDLPVIWTAHKDTHRHFDIRQFNCILWESPGDLTQPLNDRIAAIVGTNTDL